MLGVSLGPCSLLAPLWDEASILHPIHGFALFVECTTSFRNSQKPYYVLVSITLITNRFEHLLCRDILHAFEVRFRSCTHEQQHDKTSVMSHPVPCWSWLFYPIQPVECCGFLWWHLWTELIRLRAASCGATKGFILPYPSCRSTPQDLCNLVELPS